MSTQEEYEAKKQERLKERTAEGRSLKRKAWAKRLLWYAGIAAVAAVLLLGIRAVLHGTQPQGEDFSRAVPILPRPHINPGDPLPEYNSNPPSSGPHFGNVARTGFREEGIPDQFLIHNLEHGDVWIAYQPDIPDEAKEILRRIAGGKVAATPRAVNDTDIALVAWGRIDTFNLDETDVLEQRIQDFIARYMHQGPERVPGPTPGGV